jgi:hypothetical protein
MDPARGLNFAEFRTVAVTPIPSLQPLHEDFRPRLEH